MLKSPRSVEELMLMTEWSREKLHDALLDLQFEGRIEQQPDGSWCRAR